VSAREKVIRGYRAFLNGGKLPYFEERGICAQTIRSAWIGYDATSGAFTYPCIARGGGLLGIHYKSEVSDEKGRRRQWWGAYADDLPPKKHGKGQTIQPRSSRSVLKPSQTSSPALSLSSAAERRTP
jgi:hypothetical protein